MAVGQRRVETLPIDLVGQFDQRMIGVQDLIEMRLEKLELVREQLARSGLQHIPDSGVDGSHVRSSLTPLPTSFQRLNRRLISYPSKNRSVCKVFHSPLVACHKVFQNSDQGAFWV